MATTTIRLPDELRARVQLAAKRAGTTTHGFIIEAIAEKTEQETRRQNFEAEANQRYTRILATGKTISWNDMRGYLKASAEGKKAARPAARKLAR